MRLIKRKNLLNLVDFVLNWAILLVFVFEMLNPWTFAKAAELGASEVPAEKAVELPQSAPRAPDKVVKAVITAYTSTADQTDDDPFVAAWGEQVYDGMIAANWLPHNTKIKIPSLFGDKVFTVADRMNPRYGYGRLDIWMDTTKAEARKFGVKRVEVEIYYVPKTVAKR